MASHYFIPLNKTPGTKGVYIRELDGHAEINVADTGTPAMLNWLNYLILGKREDGSPLKAEEVVVSDRDQLLAAVYQSVYGSDIESTINCRQCNNPYDFNFSLNDLIKHLSLQETALEVNELGDGNYELPDGTRFRLPTGEDELSVIECPVVDKEQMMLSRCVVKKDSRSTADNIEQAMLQVAPILETDLLSTCPACGKEQLIHFDIQSLLLLKLVSEKNELIRQIHLLASTYHWSHREILDLPRNERKGYSSIIESERRH